MSEKSEEIINVSRNFSCHYQSNGVYDQCQGASSTQVCLNTGLRDRTISARRPTTESFINSGERECNINLNEESMEQHEFRSTHLEVNMESLDLDCDNSLVNNILKPASINSQCLNVSSNRRYSLRPQKQVVETSEYAVTPSKKKTTLRRNGLLETIFESPINKKGSISFLGSRNPRTISFSHFVSKAKIRQRKLKIKSLNKKNHKTKKSSLTKLTIDDVKLKLKNLEESSDELEWMDISTSLV